MMKLFVIGRLGKDAELKTINGKQVIDFPLAHSRRIRTPEGGSEKTTWINCSYWTEHTGVLPFLKKGMQIHAEGLPEVAAYMKDNVPMGSLRLRIANIELLGSREYTDRSTQHHNTDRSDATNEGTGFVDEPF